MTIEAELADGTILEFPDDTPQGVIQAAVKRQVLGGKDSVVGAGGTPLEQLDRLNGALPPETVVPVADNRPFLSKYVTGPIRNAAETAIEPALAMAFGLGSTIAGNVAGVGKEIMTGDFGKGTAQRAFEFEFVL